MNQISLLWLLVVHVFRLLSVKYNPGHLCLSDICQGIFYCYHTDQTWKQSHLDEASVTDKNKVMHQTEYGRKYFTSYLTTTTPSPIFNSLVRKMWNELIPYTSTPSLNPLG